MNSLKGPGRCIALIDIGNTRMKIGWLDPETGRRETVALALDHKNPDQLELWFTEQKVCPASAVGVNVAGDQNAQAIDAFFAEKFGVGVRWLGSQPQAANILNRYIEPARLGADRWIAMIGLSGVQPDASVPLLLASFGTATTMDTLCPASLATTAAGHSVHGDTLTDNIRWVYDGGLIFPGPGLMRASLASNTAQLPEANGSTTAFPTDTHKAITSGIAAAQAGALVRQWQAIMCRYGVAPCVYGTGGGWPAIQDEAQALLATFQQLHHVPEQPIQYLPSPILDGLARMAASL